MSLTYTYSEKIILSLNCVGRRETPRESEELYPPVPVMPQKL